KRMYRQIIHSYVMLYYTKEMRRTVQQGGRMMNKPILWLDEELDPKPSLSLVNGYRNCTCIRTEVELRRALPVASAIIVYTAYTKLRDRQTTIIHMRRLP